MPKKQKADARLDEMQEKFLLRCQELWDTHEAEFMNVLEESENRKVNLTFVAAMDFSESTAKLETSMRFSQVVKDKKTDDFDDPNQTRLPGIADGPGEAKPKKGKVKPSAKDGKAAAANDDSNKD